MYCFSSSLTVSQSRCSSSATSLIVAAAAAPAHVEGKALGVERVVGQEVQPLALHPAAPAALRRAAPRTRGRCACRRRTDRARGDACGRTSPSATRPQQPQSRFFERRTSRTTRALGSPNTPTTSGKGRNPGNRYASSRRFRLVEEAIGNHANFRSSSMTTFPLWTNQHFVRNHPHFSAKTQ